MKKLFEWQTWLIMSVFACFVVLAAGSMEPIDEETVPSIPEDVLDKVEGIVHVNVNIAEWDDAYLSNKGYFCFKKDMEESETNKYNSLVYMSPDGSDISGIVATKDECMPTQLVTQTGILYFSFPNDTILELIHDNGTLVEMLDSIPYKKSELPGFTKYRDDTFKSIIANIAALLEKNTNKKELTSRYAAAFNAVAALDYTTATDILNELGISPKGQYEFSEKAAEWYSLHVGLVVYNTLSIWTGKASFKVGGSSCTLSGTIWCPSSAYNEVGTYGILCDTDAENLKVGKAEYQGTGYQSPNDLSFSVDFRGFKPNTTYYYRAYYQFNDEVNHGNLIPKNGNSSDIVVYDQNIKSFTTGDNRLHVDVVMCIDWTGSMGGIINTVKRNAIGFYDAFKDICDETNIELEGLTTQVVAFQDKNVDNPWLLTSPTYTLPEERESFNGYVSKIYASGGGDIPESGLEALDVAFSKSDWGIDDGFHRQVVILWTDAPYLVGSAYTDLTVEDIEAKWNSLPSGRRLILFAPNGAGYYNGGDWQVMDTWKNVIHETDLATGFSNFDYILRSIIGELTSKAPSKAPSKTKKSTQPYFFLPNK